MQSYSTRDLVEYWNYFPSISTRNLFGKQKSSPWSKFLCFRINWYAVVVKAFLTKFSIFYLGDGDINDVLIKTLAEAHANTNTKLEIVHEMFRKPQVSICWLSDRN